MNEDAPTSPATPVEALRRGLELLELIAAAPPTGVAAGALSRHTALRPTTVQNLVKTLCLCGFARRADRGFYASGWKLLSLLRAGRIAQVAGGPALPHLRALAAETGEAVVLATLAAGRRRIVARAAGTQTVRVELDAAEKLDEPLWARVTGRVLAAWCDAEELEAILAREGLPGRHWDGIATRSRLTTALAHLRSTGHAISLQSDLAAVAVPVLDGAGQALAALGLYLPAYRFTTALRAPLLRSCQAAAARIAALEIEPRNLTHETGA